MEYCGGTDLEDPAPMRPLILQPLALALLLAFGIVPARAQTAPGDAMKAAAQKAITNNPDVTARLNELRAAVEAMDIARAGMRPQIGLEASVGHDRDRFANRTPAEQGVTRGGAARSRPSGRPRP